MEYRISLRAGEDGYWVAQCLEVPGAISQGRTREEALAHVNEALELVLEEPAAQASRGGELVRVTVRAEAPHH